MKLKLPKTKLNKKYLLIGTLLVLVTLTGFLLLAQRLVKHFDRYSYSVRLNPVQVTWLGFVDRQVRIPVVQTRYLNPEGEKIEFETDIEKYICEKFGEDCLTAIAVARAESGMRKDALNSNDGSPRNVDVGIFQINLKYHEKREGCSLAELTDQYKNVDCAYTIYKEQGFEPWVAFQRGMHLAFLKQ